MNDNDIYNLQGPRVCLGILVYIYTLITLLSVITGPESGVIGTPLVIWNVLSMGTSVLTLYRLSTFRNAIESFTGTCSGTVALFLGSVSWLYGALIFYAQCKSNCYYSSHQYILLLIYMHFSSFLSIVYIIKSFYTSPRFRTIFAYIYSGILLFFTSLFMMSSAGNIIGSETGNVILVFSFLQLIFIISCYVKNVFDYDVCDIPILFKIWFIQQTMFSIVIFATKCLIDECYSTEPLYILLIIFMHTVTFSAVIYFCIKACSRLID